MLEEYVKSILQPIVLTTLFYEYSIGLSFQGGKEKEEENIGLIHQNASSHEEI